MSWNGHEHTWPSVKKEYGYCVLALGEESDKMNLILSFVIVHDRCMVRREGVDVSFMLPPGYG
jgi:hypothetical protein